MSFGDALQIATIVVMGALAVDRWIHRREFNESRLVEDVKTLKEQVRHYANKSSENEGRVSSKIISMELDIRELQTHWQNYYDNNNSRRGGNHGRE